MLTFGTAVDNSGLRSGLNAAQTIVSAAEGTMNNGMNISVSFDTNGVIQAVNSLQSTVASAIAAINGNFNINPDIDDNELRVDLDRIQNDTERSGEEMESDLNVRPTVDSSGMRTGLTKLENYVSTTAAALTADIIRAVTAAFAEIPKQITALGSGFESSMAQVVATMGISKASEEFDILSDKAKEMGEATKFSASEAGDALNYLALAGYSAEKSCAALPTVLNVAAAGGIDLAAASDMVTDSMSALGVSMDELENFSDKLAKTSQKSNTSVAQLGAAIISVGANARVLKGGTTELMTELGILADSGLKSAEAGTALARVIKNLSTPTQVSADELARLGVSCYDAEGNFRNIDLMKRYHEALVKLRDSGASASLLSEMMSLDPEDGIQMADYMLSSGDFSKINELYKEREAVAAELAQDFYAPEIAALNADTVEKISAEYGALPTELQAIGQLAIINLGKGMDMETDNLFEHISANVDRAVQRAETVIDNYSSGGLTEDISEDMTAKGKADGEAYAAGFEEGAGSISAQVEAEVNTKQTAAASGQAQLSQLDGLLKGITSAIKDIRIFNTITSRLDLDRKTIAQAVNEYNSTLGRVSDSYD